MKIKIFLPNVRPCSINKAYYSRNKVLTKDAREFRTSFLEAINKSESNRNLMKAFKDAFNPSLHCLHISYEYLIPEDAYFTKAGEISMRSGDVDNFIKLTSDFLMNEKYFNDPYRLEEGDCYNLGVDDRFVTDYTVKKRPAEGWAIIIEAEIRALDEVFQDIGEAKNESEWNIVLSTPKKP